MTRYIDADLAIEKLLTVDDQYSAERDFALKVINSEPSADVQPVVHAKWIHDSELYYGMHNSYHCSKCGRIIRIVVPETLEDYPYCHCGAKMDGDEHDTD